MWLPTLQDTPSELWMAAFRACQDEVAICNPHPYYLGANQQVEDYYWLPLLHWIYEDSMRQTPRNYLDISCAYGTLLYIRRLSNSQLYAVDFVDAYMSQALIEKYDLHF